MARKSVGKRGEQKDNSRAKLIQDLGPYLGLGWVLAVAVGGGTLAGVYIDGQLGTAPWLTLLGLILGMTAGFISVFRTVLGGVSKPSSGTSRPDGREPMDRQVTHESRRTDGTKEP